MRIIGVKMHKRTGGITDFVEFRLSEVNYIEMWRHTKNSNKIPIYHTPAGSYLAVSTIKDITVGYSRYGFKRYGGSTVINEKLVRDRLAEECGTTIVFHCGNRVFVNKKHKL